MKIILNKMKKLGTRKKITSIVLVIFAFTSLSLFSVASSMPMLVVTKTDNLVGDVNMNTQADPGDTLEYSVLITNTGTANATNVVFSDTLDVNTTISGTARVSPLAFKDSYNSIGNVGINVLAANGLLLNDADPDNNVSLSVAAVNGVTGNVGSATATTQSGTVTVQSNGSFVYTPAPGFEGDDTFTYTISDGDPKTRDDTDTVTITVNEVIWFIDGSQAAQGNGTLASPFNTLNGATGFQTAAADEAGDIIFVYDGNYIGVNLILLAGQKLLGDGMSGTVAAAAGITLPAHSNPLPIPTGTDPILTNGAGIGVRLATNNTIRGLTVGNTGGTGIQDNGNVGTLTISESSIIGNGGGFEVDNGGTLAVTLDALSAVATAANEEGIHINATGSFNVLNGTGMISTNGAPAVVINGSNNLNLNILAFANVSANNAAYGIRLTDINAGSFTVNGSGTTDGSGGTIQNITTRGVEINNTDNVTLKNINLTNANTADGVSAVPNSTCDRLDGTLGTNTGCNAAIYMINSATIALDNLNIDDTEQNGVNGNNVTGLTLTNSVFTDIGNIVGGQRENALHVINLLGTSVINGNTFTGNSTHTTRNVLIENSTGTLNLTMNDNTIATANTNGVRMYAEGSATMNVSGLRNTFNQNGDTEFEFNAVGNSVIDVDLGDGTAPNENVFIGTPAAVGSGAGIVIDGRDSARFTFNILANELRPLRSSGIIVAAFGAASGEGNIIGNEVQGNEQGWGIRASAESQGASSPSMIVDISNNIVGNVNPIGSAGSAAAGIEVSSQQGSAGAGTANVQGTVNNNTVTIGGADSIIQHYVDFGNSLCLNVTNNDGSGAGTSAFAGQGSTHFIGNPPDENTTNAGVVTYVGYLSGQLGTAWANNGNTSDVAVAAGNAGEAYVGGTEPTAVGSCTTPSVRGPSPALIVSTPALSGSEIGRLQELAAGEPPALLQVVDLPNFESSSVVVVDYSNTIVTTAGRPSGLALFAQSGETINQSIGTMEPDQVVEIVFQATVDNPLTPVTTTQVCNQANVMADTGIDVDSNQACTTLATGSIVIVQNTDPDGAADFEFSSPGLTPASFTLDDDSDGTFTNTQTITDVAPGGYGITQTVAAGYFLSALSCDDGSSGAASTTDLGNGAATVNVESGETVTCTFTNELSPIADLSITKSDGQTTAVPGETITYTLVISNAGPDPVTGVTVTDTVPADISGVAWTCASEVGATCTASGSGSLSESVDLAAGTGVTFTVNGLIDSATTGTLSNTATVTVPTGVVDPTPGNNSATDNDTVLVPTADLSVSKIDSADPVLAGDTLTYTVTVTNAGPSDATSVQVTDTLPVSVTLDSSSGCAEDPNGAPTCNLGTVSAGSTVSYTLVVDVDAGTTGTMTNTVSVASAATDPVSSNNGYTETTEIVAVPAFSVSDIQITEGDSGTVDFVFTISRTHNSVLNTVDVATQNDTAVAPGDYTAFAPQTLSFPAGGPLTQTVTVTVNGDTEVEPIETFELVLSSPTDATLGDSTGVGTIPNDDSATVTLTGGGAEDETDSGTTTRVFTATLNAAVQGGFDVAYTTNDITAETGDSDYVNNDGTLSFTGSANETQTITVTINGDTKVETNETFNVTLGAISNTTVTDTISVDGSPQVGTITNDDTATVTLSGGSAQIEGDSGTITYTFGISLDVGVQGSFFFDLQTVDGTATVADGDYQPFSATLNFNGTPNSGATFEVIAFGDTNGEADESFTLELSPIYNTIFTDSINVVGNPQTATILNDDPGVFFLSSGSPTITESAITVPVTVTLSAPETFTTSVDYGTMAGTATAGSDYTETSGTFIFAPGETVKTLSIPILDDTIFEDDETIIIALSNPMTTTLGNPFTTTLTIVDDEALPMVGFSAAAFSVGESDGSVPVTVTLDHGSASTVTVMLQSADATATAASDYTTISQTVTFAPGELTQTVDVSILDDGVYEGNETLMLTLSNPVSGTLGSPLTATVTILDDEAPPTINLASSTASVSESTESVVLTVTLDHGSISTVTVLVQSADSTATAGSDYAAVNQTVTFAPGELTQTVDVSILDDGVYEGNETLLLTLSNPVSGTLGSPVTATVTILDDEALPTINLASSTASVGESDGTLPVTVTLDHSSANTVTVMVQSADGTPISIASAAAGSDYTAISQTITFAPGETSQVVNIAILPDSDDEPNEEFSLTLTAPSNGSLGSTTSMVVTIVDDDEPSTNTVIYLPIISRNGPSGPDLVVDSIDVVNGSVELTIKNVGNAPVNQVFWVDLFVNPAVLPTKVNDTTESLNQPGLVWGINPSLVPIAPGASINLTVNDSSFAATYSTFSGTISAGDLLVAHVDSANSLTTYGGVNESHEMSSGTYNNITSTPAPAAAIVPDLFIEVGQRSSLLPIR